MYRIGISGCLSDHTCFSSEIRFWRKPVRQVRCALWNISVSLSHLCPIRGPFVSGNIFPVREPRIARVCSLPNRAQKGRNGCRGNTSSGIWHRVSLFSAIVLHPDIRRCRRSILSSCSGVCRHICLQASCLLLPMALWAWRHYIFLSLLMWCCPYAIAR